MKTLSLIQPWASLVILGRKRYETRSWGVSYRGELAIHASKEFPRDCKLITHRDPYAKLLEDVSILPLGAVLGIVRVVGVTRLVASCAVAEIGEKYNLAELAIAETEADLARVSDSHRAARTLAITRDEHGVGDFSVGRFAWELEVLERFEKPIPAKGNRGLWDWRRP